jgi:hypothetical protein
MRINKVVLVLLMLYATSVFANVPPPEAKQEIMHLLSYLQASGCQFYRNGSWYGSSEAAKHLNSKYQYLLKKGLVSTSEAFIDRAASQSSMSGAAYRVKCGSDPEINSAEWFRAELANYRRRKQ